jgi:predicted GNAT family acetyltransferase
MSSEYPNFSASENKEGFEGRISFEESNSGSERIKKIFLEGEKIGVFAYKDHSEYYSIAFITIDEKLRGKGIGEIVYKKLAESLDKPLRSDMELSEPGENLWKKFVAKGLAKRIGEIPNGRGLYEYVK